MLLLGKPHEANLVLSLDDTPRRGVLCALASANQNKSSDKWRFGDREGNQPIPVGAVVTVNIDKVDRAHTDPKR